MRIVKFNNLYGIEKGWVFKKYRGIIDATSWQWWPKHTVVKYPYFCFTADLSLIKNIFETLKSGVDPKDISHKIVPYKETLEELLK